MQSTRKVIGGLGNLMFKQAYLVGEMLDGKIPDVYVQSDKYWKKHAHIIKPMFSEVIGYVDKVAIHIRRGDYVDNPFYVDLWKTDYYQKALALFPNDNFIVFCKDNQGWETDKADRQWCRDNLDPLIKGRYELAPKENEEWEDMNLMASCKHRIGANSSFSWWACRLGTGMNVMPGDDKWFSDRKHRIDLPIEWIVL
jgi:hypothetical protein